MIVDEPPYELVALVADEDARQFLMRLIERGQNAHRACLRSFRWKAIRDPRRDAVVRSVDATLRPFIAASGPRFIVLWDHDGSGREAEPADAVEQDVKRSLVQAGAAEEHVETIAFVPELEVALGPAWTRTTEELALRRSVSPPSEQDILVHLGGGRLTQELAERPKEVFDALLRTLNLRHSAELFQMLGDRLSIPSLKSGHALERLSKALRRWFSAG